MIKKYQILGVHVHCSSVEMLKGTCSCVGMLKEYMGNKRLGIPALKVRSKNL